jgi:CheY-like chemotaxis protein
MKILLADDDIGVREAIKITLVHMGHQVIEAVDGNEAVAMLESEQMFDFLITDNNMPGKKGLEVIKIARKVKPSTKVILMTGWPTQEVKDECERLGIQRLGKPFTIEILKKALEAKNE